MTHLIDVLCQLNDHFGEKYPSSPILCNGTKYIEKCYILTKYNVPTPKIPIIIMCKRNFNFILANIINIKPFINTKIEVEKLDGKIKNSSNQ